MVHRLKYNVFFEGSQVRVYNKNKTKQNFHKMIRNGQRREGIFTKASYEV
jgi:hypothetical protein